MRTTTELKISGNCKGEPPGGRLCKYAAGKTTGAAGFAGNLLSGRLPLPLQNFPNPLHLLLCQVRQGHGVLSQEGRLAVARRLVLCYIVPLERLVDTGHLFQNRLRRGLLQSRGTDSASSASLPEKPAPQAARTVSRASTRVSRSHPCHFISKSPPFAWFTPILGTSLEKVSPLALSQKICYTIKNTLLWG